MSRLNNNEILLIQPNGNGASASGGRGDVVRVTSNAPPIGLASMAAYLEQRAIRATIVDAFTQGNPDETIRTFLAERQPAWVGFSCMTANFLDGVRLASACKDALPGVRTLFGGPHVSALKDEILRHWPAVDIVVVGEGERPIAALIQQEGLDLERVPGLIYRTDEEEIRFSGLQDAGLVLDDLPFPAYEKLHGFPRAYRLPIFNYPSTPHSSCVTSRGCPYTCSYCDRSVFGRNFRYNSADYVYRHLAHLKRQYGIRHVTFYDDQFTLDRERVMALTDQLARKPLGMTFNCAVRAEHVDLELLKQMKAAGCWMASLGIETGDADLLAQHRQNADLDMLRTKIQAIKTAGIRVKGLLMMGLPGEDQASIRRSMDYVFSLPLDDLNLAKFTPFPGSPLYTDIHQMGTFEEDWPAMDCLSFQFVPHGMTRTELEQCFKAFYRAHFSRPSVLLGYLAMIWRSPDSWRRFFLNLGTFLRFATRGNRR